MYWPKKVSEADTQYLNHGVHPRDRRRDVAAPQRIAPNFLQLRVRDPDVSNRPRQRTHRMPRLESGPHGLKADASAGADDQDCRHSIDVPGRTRPLTVLGDTSSRYLP